MRGGTRVGAGRKKGAQNKVTAQMREKALAEGVSSLDFMLKIMRDETQPLSIRADMAKAAAPYVHPRLQAIEHNGKNGGPIQYKAVIEFV